MQKKQLDKIELINLHMKTYQLDIHCFIIILKRFNNKLTKEGANRCGSRLVLFS